MGRLSEATAAPATPLPPSPADLGAVWAALARPRHAHAARDRVRRRRAGGARRPRTNPHRQAALPLPPNEGVSPGLAMARPGASLRTETNLRTMSRSSRMIVELRNLADITPYAGNPRHNDAAVDAVAASIREFGFRQPIVVDEQGVIIVGHTRYKAALKLGLQAVPVHVAHGLSPAQAKAYRIADNQAATLSQWAEGKL